MSKQVQQRGDTETNLNSSTPAAREMAVNTTKNRLHIGDGSTSGGIPMGNFNDIRDNIFAGADAAGTADALTMTLSPAPASYVKYMEVVFKAASNNTAAATINVNALGVKDIKKLDAGAIANLGANDIVSGLVYKLIYDGTQFILFGLEAGGLDSVSQGDLNTTTGTVSLTTSSETFFTTNNNVDLAMPVNGASHVVLPGGQYGFAPETKGSSTFMVGWWLANDSTTYTTGAIPFAIASNPISATVDGQQRYVTSSPPFDMGDGECGGFIFLKIKKGSGDILGHYAADVPPWGYNGPTNIMACKKCPITGEKMRRVMKQRSLEEIMDGAKIEHNYEKITQQIKNADMGLIPHPFGILSEDETCVMLDPVDERLKKLIELQNIDREFDLSDVLRSGQIYTEDESLSRKGPKGVKITPLRYKYTRS